MCQGTIYCQRNSVFSSWKILVFLNLNTLIKYKVMMWGYIFFGAGPGGLRPTSEPSLPSSSCTPACSLISPPIRPPSCPPACRPTVCLPAREVRLSQSESARSSNARATRHVLLSEWEAGASIRATLKNKHQRMRRSWWSRYRTHTVQDLVDLNKSS